MTLFPDAAPDTPRPASSAPTPAAPRIREANRTQVCLRPLDLEGLLPEDHRARIVWAYVEGLDLTPLYQAIQAVDGEAGRPATDPKLLLALWLYATLEAVGSARALDRLCTTHLAYQWLCGGVPMNYHTLADFRTAQGAFLDTLLTQGVAVLLAAGVVTLERVAQDGVKVRASAGAASFRRRTTLEACLAEAATQVQTLRAELDADPGATTARQKAARARAGVAFVHYRWCRRRNPPGESAFFQRIDKGDFSAIVILLAALLNGFFTLRLIVNRVLSALLAPAVLGNALSCSQSVIINLSAVALMVYAQAQRSREVRNVAILVTLIGAGNVFLYDLIRSHGLPLVISVLSFGLATAVESVILGRWPSPSPPAPVEDR